jgi:hypothetical protein
MRRFGSTISCTDLTPTVSRWNCDDSCHQGNPDAASRLLFAKTVAPSNSADRTVLRKGICSAAPSPRQVPLDGSVFIKACFINTCEAAARLRRLPRTPRRPSPAISEIDKRRDRQRGRGTRACSCKPGRSRISPSRRQRFHFFERSHPRQAGQGQWKACAGAAAKMVTDSGSRPRACAHAPASATLRDAPPRGGRAAPVPARGQTDSARPTESPLAANVVNQRARQGIRGGTH